MAPIARSVALWALLLFGLGSPLHAAAPRDDLLRLVPDDAGFCLLVENLRQHTAQVMHSPFAAYFRASPLGAVLNPSTPEMQKLAEVERFFREHLQIDLARVRDDIVGDAVAFVYRPGPPGRPEQEQGLILVWSRDPDLRAAYLKRFDEAQQQSGDLREVQSRSHDGVPYVRRVEDKATRYVYQRGPVLAVTSREDLLRQTIDRDRAAPGPEGLAARQLRDLGGAGALARLWLNRRAFEPDLRQKAAVARGAEAAVLSGLLTYWQALQGVVVSLGLNADAELTLALRADAAGLPPAARRFFALAAEASELWGRFPEDALLAAAGRCDAAALVDMLGGFLDGEARQAMRASLDRILGPALSQDVVRDVLPNLGPDCGVCVLAPAAADKGWFPHVLAAVRVRPGDGAIPADLAVLGALNSFAMLAVLDHNRKHPDQPVRLRATWQDQVEVKYLEGDAFPAGVRPAFALKDGYLLLASSPAVVARFRAPAAAVPAPTPVPLLRLSVRALHQFVKDRRETLVAESATKHQITREEAGRQLDHLLAVVQLFDRVELTQRTGNGQLSLTLRVRLAQPLK
jgi:hypothetical protein